jgi:hypothetical protein
MGAVARNDQIAHLEINIGVRFGQDIAAEQAAGVEHVSHADVADDYIEASRLGRMFFLRCQCRYRLEITLGITRKWLKARSRN